MDDVFGGGRRSGQGTGDLFFELPPHYILDNPFSLVSQTTPPTTFPYNYYPNKKLQS